MGDWLTANQTKPTTPASGWADSFVDSTTKRIATLDDGGIVRGGPLSKNFATAAQGLLATTEVYLTNSNLLIPSWGMQAGDTFVWEISVVKTAASTAAPIWTFRIGAAGAVGDTSRLALTSTQAQTAVASGVIAGSGGSGGGPGFGGGGSGASSTFDNSALAGQYVGLTVTTGASAAWTVNGLSCYLIN